MKVLNPILSIKTIMCIRLIGGLYYKISSNRLITALAKAYCVLVSVAMISVGVTVLMNQNLFNDTIRLSLQLILYMANYLVNFFCNSENFLVFINSIRKIDDNATLDDVIPVSRILFVVLLVVRFSSHVIFCSAATFPCIKVFLAADLVAITSHFTRIMMFEILGNRIKFIRKRFERKLTVRRIEDGEEIVVVKLRKCMKAYTSLLNTAHKTDAMMKPLVTNLYFTSFGSWHHWRDITYRSLISFFNKIKHMLLVIN